MKCMERRLVGLIYACNCYTCTLSYFFINMLNCHVIYEVLSPVHQCTRAG